MKRYAFTIWELLAVVAIVLVAAVLLYPVFAIRHTKDPRTYYASNEKQLSLAILQYVEDYDGSFPNIASLPDGKTTWRNAISDYVKRKSIYQCPGREDRAVGPDDLPRSYAANYTGNYSGSRNDKGNGVIGGFGSTGIKMKDIGEPDGLIMLCEVWHHNTPDFNIDNLAVFSPHSHSLWAGHTGRSNYAFADGHVKWLMPEATRNLWHRDLTVPLTPAALTILANAQQRARDDK